MTTGRRNALKLSLAGAGLAALPRRRAVAAAAPPIRLGPLCVKTGPLAAGGNGFRFTQQYFQYGLGGRKPLIGGNIENRALFMHALRIKEVAHTARGPMRFDASGNAIDNVYMRAVEQQEGRLVKVPVHTYHEMSQFWTCDPASFLKRPVYSKTWPPARYLEQ